MIGPKKLANLVRQYPIRNTQVNFKVVYTIRTNLFRFPRIRLLKTAEALAIHDLKPELREQMKYVLSLSLNWP